MISILSPWNYLREIWKRRYFWLALVKLDLDARYRRSFLGIGWSLLNPLAYTSVMCLVFYQIFEMDLREYAPYVFTGVAIWNFISNSVLEGCQSILVGEKYIRSYPAPLAMYSLRSTLSIGLHFLILLIFTIFLSWIVRGFDNLIALPILIPVLILLFFFSWALTTIFGIITVYFPDTHHLASILLQLIYYLTPVFYPKEMLAKRGMLVNILTANPLGYVVELIRRPVLYGEIPGFHAFFITLNTTLVLAIIAVALLAANERKIIFNL
ncbi:MAG: ABC transporter permease [Gemmatales bacterium]|nr:ABC transporter permease [Gemmatales bacterium]MDW7993760.1 ABC transporter permease [Gemmatales bacterium]